MFNQIWTPFWWHMQDVSKHLFCLNFTPASLHSYSALECNVQISKPWFCMEQISSICFSVLIIRYTWMHVTIRKYLWLQLHCDLNSGAENIIKVWYTKINIKGIVVSSSQNLRLTAESMDSIAAFIGQGPLKRPSDWPLKQPVTVDFVQHV